MKYMILALLFVTMTSCSTYSLMSEREILKLDPTYQFVQSESTFIDLGEWWKVFKSDELDTLVKLTITNNLEVQASLAAIDQQNASLNIAQNSSLPSLSAGVDATRSATPTTSNGSVSTQDSGTYALNLNASYTVDLYGGNAYSLSAAEMTLLSTIEDHRTLVSSKVETLVGTWLTIQELESRIALLNREIKANEDNVGFVTQRHKIGLSTTAEILQARQQLINSKITLPTLINELNTARHAMKTLVGQYPETNSYENKLDFSMILPHVSAGLPSELIKRRSDIRSALLAVKIADNQVGEAVAATFPQISLTASTGTTSPDLQNVINPEYSFWKLVGGLTMPILDSDGRKQQVEVNKAALKQSLLNYQNIVYSAFQEVADNLSGIKTKTELIELLKQQVLISEQTVTQTLASYREGLTDWSDLLDAQTSYYTAEDSLISAQKDLITLNISLMVSLGETWTNQLLPNTDTNS